MINTRYDKLEQLSHWRYEEIKVAVHFDSQLWGRSCGWLKEILFWASVRWYSLFYSQFNVEPALSKLIEKFQFQALLRQAVIINWTIFQWTLFIDFVTKQIHSLHP